VLGEVIDGRFELEALVGSGGMSAVYRAHDSLLERNVAIKILHEHFGRDADQVERFRREARAVAQLSHPNIVTVIDRGERDGRQFIVFEYVDGENLKQLVVRAGPLPVRRVLEIAGEVAQGLAFAHRQGLVHRDVKPQNVLIPPGGQAKVTDFGIARSLDVDGLTQTGSVLGTSHYIAPEQARGDTVDERTDVYALGAVLFELLTGEVPYEGDSFVAVALRHVHDPVPSVRDRRPEVSPRLDALVRRAMAKDPSDRFASMDEVEAELEACLDELGPDVERDATMVVPPSPPAARPVRPPARSKPPQKRRRGVALPLVLALLATAIAAGAVLVAHYGLPGSGSAKSSTSPTTTGGRTTPTGGQAVPLAAVRSWDPYGDNHTENEAAIGNATDGDATTYWSTEGYDSTLAELGKPGVGIVLRADSTIKHLTVTTDTPGFVAEIKTSSGQTGPFDAAAPSRTVARQTTFDLDPGDKRYVLIWITKLAHPDRYRAHVNEVTAGS
jgi:serine/threonine protein kinase